MKTLPKAAAISLKVIRDRFNADGFYNKETAAAYLLGYTWALEDLGHQDVADITDLIRRALDADNPTHLNQTIKELTQ